MSTKTTPRRKRSIFQNSYDFPEGQNPMWVYLDGYKDDSRRTMKTALESIADILTDGKIEAEKLAWHNLRSRHATALRGRLTRFYSPSTANRYLCALRGVLKEAWRLELIDRETMERTLDVAPIRGKREQRGRAVTKDEILAVFGACAADKNASAGARDAAVLSLLYGAGLRRSEAVSLKVEDLDLANSSASVIGKGNKARTVFLPAGAVAAIQSWLEVRGHEPGPLVTHVAKNGRVRMLGVTDQLVYHIVRKRHLQAGIAPFAPHDLRRSFISELLDGGVDLATVARQVGHSNVQTTALYDRRDQTAQRRGVLGLDVPFPGAEKAV